MTKGNQLESRILSHTQHATELYYRLVIVTGASRLDVRETARILSMQHINVGLELSQSLLEMPLKSRSSRLGGLLSEVTGESGTVLLDNLEILFDRSLEQDPLRLLQSLSRNRTVVAVWSGALEDRKLTYAAPGHPEYHCYRTEGLVVVDAEDLP